MTAHKHFKQLVRERMKKTGERYAAARRNLLSEHSEPPLDPAARWHQPGQIPAATALRVLLNAAGVPNSLGSGGWTEEAAFGLAGGIGIGVAAFLYEKEDFASFYVAGRHLWHDFEAYFRGALDPLGVRPQVRESGGSKAAEANLRAALSAGRPCIAWVDAPSLPHRGMPEWMRGGGYHVVTVYTVDDSKGTVLIGDASDAPIELPLETLTAARGRIKKDKHRLLWIESDGSGAERAASDTASLIRDALRRCADGLVSRPIKQAGDMFHLDGLGKWAERMHGKASKESWSHVFPRGGRFWQGLTSVFEYIEHYGTGGGLSRAMFARYLGAASRTVKTLDHRAVTKLVRQLDGLAEHYAALGAAWSALADAALPDHVPLFREAKDLLTRKAELWADVGPEATEEIRAVWSRLGELSRAAKADFPLSDAECDALRADLRGRIEQIHAAEVAGLELLRSASGVV